MRVDRAQVRVSRIESEGTEEAVSLTKSEALSFIWELSQEVFSLSGRYDVESRLQRHVVSVIRK